MPGGDVSIPEAHFSSVGTKVYSMYATKMSLASKSHKANLAEPRPVSICKKRIAIRAVTNESVALICTARTGVKSIVTVENMRKVIGKPQCSTIYSGDESSVTMKLYIVVTEAQW